MGRGWYRGWSGRGVRRLGLFAGVAVVALTLTASGQAVVVRGWSFWPGAPTDQNGPVAALSTKDVWVVGQAASNDHGTVAHWDGSAWSSQTLPGLASVDAVAAGDASNVWAGGGGQIDHYDGTSWSTQTTPSPGSDDALTDIAASSASNAWAVGSYDVTGAGGMVQHLPLPLQYNGTTWSLQPAVIPGTNTDTVFTAVATLSSTDVWAVGRTSADAFSPTEPLVEHWNGTSWSVSFLPTTGFDGGALTDVYEASPTNVWAIGSRM